MNDSIHVFEPEPIELRPSNPAEPGIVRRRRGRGFSYQDARGRPVRDPATIRRVKALAIPPAWTDVWICADPLGHVQAVGTDAAGRRQYRYHDEWRRQQDRAKFDRVLLIAEHLPAFRARVAEHLQGRGLTRRRVLATAARMLDVGFFRVGGEEYTDSFGLATLRVEHITCANGTVTCSYPAKGGKQREQLLADEQVCAVVRALCSRGAGELLRFKEDGRWRDVRSADINAYLKEIFGAVVPEEVTAKDFRTWHATVLAAVGLAVSAPARGSRGQKRAVSRVMTEVAEYLGNTPAVARASYVDPRVVELYERGHTIAPALAHLGADAETLGTHGEAEKAVIELLRRTTGRTTGRTRSRTGRPG